jgi:hypothetical protein
MRAQRRRFLRLRGAAAALQAAWRGRRARAQLRRAAAAAQIQRCATGRHATALSRAMLAHQSHTLLTCAPGAACRRSRESPARLHAASACLPSRPAVVGASTLSSRLAPARAQHRARVAGAAQARRAAGGGRAHTGLPAHAHTARTVSLARPAACPRWPSIPCAASRCGSSSLERPLPSRRASRGGSGKAFGGVTPGWDAGDARVGMCEPAHAWQHFLRATCTHSQR